MADALLSPAVGLTFLSASGATLVFCASRVRKSLDDHIVPLMGVLGAFIFAAQMINFTIPGTGSSGHLGGGLLLALLLGPEAAFLTIASVLVIQAFFFADGGLLALGSNIFNIGIFPCFVGLPLFRLIAGKKPTSGRLTAASVVAAATGLEMGALGVVTETLLSGRSDLSFGPFVTLMGGIHLPIGIVEGFVTAAVLGYILKIRPELAAQALGTTPEAGRRSRSLAPVLASFAVAALLAAGLLARFASERPDGLEWSLERLSAGKEEAAGTESGLAGTLAKLQRRTAFFPDYALPGQGGGQKKETNLPTRPACGEESPGAGPFGALLTLGLAGALGVVVTRRRHAVQR